MFSSSIRGQLGMPYKQFGELRNNLDKLRTNFDLIVNGHMNMHELDIANADDCQMIHVSDKDEQSK